MGNFSPAIEQRRAELRNDLRENMAERDRRFPKMERPCGTPGAVYTVTVEANVMGCTVVLPFSIEASLPAEAKEEMQKALHDAVLPIVERFYRQVWAETIAGKKLADDPEPMPKRWGLLFTKWLKRSFERGEMVSFDGSTAFSPDGLQDEYRWWI